MTIELVLTEATPTAVTGGHFGDVTRLRRNAERVRSVAAQHRATAGDGQELLARVADLHALAYDALAEAALARANAVEHCRHSGEWCAAVERARVAARRAEAWYARAQAVAADSREDTQAAARYRHAAEAFQQQSVLYQDRRSA